MTSMDVDLDKSLDEIAASNRKSTHRRERGGGRPHDGLMRKPRGAGGFDRNSDRGSNRRQEPYHRTNQQHHRPTPGGNIDGSWKHDLYYEGRNSGNDGAGPIRTFANQNAGAGGGPRKRAVDKSAWGLHPGPNVRVSNIHWNVSESDLLELCQYKLPDSAIVELKLHYDNAGRSEGVADVTFARDEDAELCVQEFNGLAIDEQYLDAHLFNPSPQSTLPISLRLGRPTNVAARLGPVNVDTSAILKRLGGRVGGSSRGGGRGAQAVGAAGGVVANTGKLFADSLHADTRTVLNYEETITPAGI
ncbi:hypothetical protein SeMB42_g05983 [Synchytrium endobioticum]|uniref:RRM domain-containing protein n=1 Tax=Synchytrium endobioticum TaxID=286115 RepID=A0A507CRK9_9FUNG|nr:hypothetical protein SeMB42_g05983 [Synchytrium endobioticum]TPX41670.1 hypothetical protein SeLEV6574_g05975 [Synchytrium endobioticum]